MWDVTLVLWILMREPFDKNQVLKIYLYALASIKQYE